MADIVSLKTEVDLLGNEVAVKADINRDMLVEGLCAQFKHLTLDEFVSYFTNTFESAVAYANLCENAKTGQRISLLFNPHRLDTGTKRFPISLFAKFQDVGFVRGLVRVIVLNQNRGVKDVLYQTIGMGVEGTSYLQEFPPHVARELALEHGLNASSKVLDPCAGWGGRMIGFSTVVNSYTCCEPSTRTAAGLRKLLAFLQSFRSTFNAEIYESPFEDVTFAPATFDFAMTSPPYYDTEYYAPGEDTNSFNRYASFDQWCDGFYAPLIHRTMMALKPGASFVINIGSRTYPLNERLFDIAKDKYVVTKQRDRLSASSGLGKSGEGETFYQISNPAGTVVDVSASVKLLTPARPRDAPRLEVVAPVSQSNRALDFALRSTDASDPAPASSPTPAPAATAELTVDDVVSSLHARGHRLLTRDGRLFISESTKLTDEDRRHVQQFKAELVARATYWPVVQIEQPSSLAQLLGMETTSTFVPDEPPSLDGIDQIILNFETNGLEWWKGHEPIGVTVGTLDGQLIRFLPFKFQGGNLDIETVKRWFEREIRGKHITNVNTRFDVHMARVFGVDLEAQGNTVSDVMHYAALLDDHRKRFALDELAKDFLGGVEVGRIDESMMGDYHAGDAAPRAKYQAKLVADLRAAMWPKLDAEDLQQVRQLEDDVIYPVVEMEKNGAPIDLALLAEYKARCEATYHQLIQEVSNELGFTFDHTTASWRRVFEKFGLRDSGSFDEEIVGAIDHPTIRRCHRAAQFASLNSKIFTPYTEKVGADGLLRFDLHQLRGEKGGTVSGRFSAPYIHQVPNADNHGAVFGDDLFPRRLFIARNGQYLAGDAAQIEYRIFASFAANKAVLAAYEQDPDMSFHKTVWEMFKQFKPDMLYTYQKSMNFMKIYGGGLIKTAVMMGFITSEEGEEIRRLKTQTTDPRLNEARAIESIYARILPETDILLKKAAHLAMSGCDEWCKKTLLSRQLHEYFPHQGYVKTITGRRARFPNNYSLHKAFNRIDQGSAADIMKRKLVELHRQRKETGFLMRMTVHDEICGDAPDDACAEKVRTILNTQTSPEIKVPIRWAVKTGRTWAECK